MLYELGVNYQNKLTKNVVTALSCFSKEGNLLSALKVLLDKIIGRVKAKSLCSLVHTFNSDAYAFKNEMKIKAITLFLHIL